MKKTEDRYSRNFLKIYEPVKNNLEFRPNWHINPIQGLINDPNCVFYKEGKLNILFQHHPTSPIHGLKAMSLATSSDLMNFEYKWLVNKPDTDFDSHGNYSGNAVIQKDKVISFYTGNSRDENWKRTSSIVYSEFDFVKKEIINKRKIVDNFDFSNKYSEHFRDPYYFNYKNEKYLLLGAQSLSEEGLILLFKINEDYTNLNLIKEISLGKRYRMIECPNLIFIKDKLIMICSPQIKNPQHKENPDFSVYFEIPELDLFTREKIIINNYEYLDIGFEFYAPQTFLIDKKWNFISWVGVPTIDNYPEHRNGWVHMLSMVRELDYDEIKKKLIINPSSIYDFKKINPICLEINEKKIVKICDGNQVLIEIDFTKGIVIKRHQGKEYYIYSNEIIYKNLENEISNIQIFYDVSIIEIKLNENLWFTSRIYINDKLIVKQSEIEDHEK